MNIGNMKRIIFVLLLGSTLIAAKAQNETKQGATADNLNPTGSDSMPTLMSSSSIDTIRGCFQRRNVYQTKWEFSTNVTLALSRFTGNVSRNLNDDPYLLMVRKIDSDQSAAWRLGLNGFRTSTQSSFPDRTSYENWASLVFGREWRTELQQGAYVYGGLDSRGIFRQSHSESTQFNDLGLAVTSITDAKEYGGSLGGVCGFGWRFQDRIAIYTEAILNAQYTRTDRTFNVNGATTTLENKNNFAIVPMVPIALFLTIKF